MEQRTTTQRAPTMERLTVGSVRVVGGPGEGPEVALGAGPLVIGAGEGCGLRVANDPGVSRRHCSVELGPHALLLKDLGSRNGTWFSGARLEHGAIAPGALVRIGSTTLQLSATAPGDQPLSQHLGFGTLLGASKAMRAVYPRLEAAARSDVTVLLGGESGTGKELAARSIHQASPRASGPLVVLDCGAVSPPLLRSELFGHLRGAFTGAVRDHRGAFERASGGTLFIDEVGELPLEHQATLQRAVETLEIVPLGASAPVRCDVRIIAATRRDLAREVAGGRFREDLLYRLQVLPVTLPPLRERLDDVPQLVDAMLADFGVIGAVPTANLAPLFSASWPGNVRELRNVVERAVVAAGKGSSAASLRFDPAEQPGELVAPEGSDLRARVKHTSKVVERQFLVELLERTKGNIRAASRDAGIERTQLKRMLRRHELLGLASPLTTDDE
ncbi:MAG: sigma 54-interacting transcriptional regulator [Myxococcales bacterium]|nr:sigma 54-interacting transcriptional regulator [Myxococcales bacterium]